MARPFTRAQALQNRAFLKSLARSGNVRLACRELGLKYGTMQHRRRHHPALAARWDAALVFSQARLGRPSTSSGRAGKRGQPFEKVAANPSTAFHAVPLPQRAGGGSYRTVGGEAVVVRLKNGRLQMRRAQPGKLTPAAEQAFLAALSATANVTLSAAAVGASPRAFYRRVKRNEGFARERRLALRQGFDRLEMVMLESSAPSSFEDDDWRRNDPPAMPPTSGNQALQLMYLHQKEARLIAEQWPFKRRRGEPSEAFNMRLIAIAEERDRRAREQFELAEAERLAGGEPAWGPAGEAARRELGDRWGFVLPDLAQVTGWSRADPAKVAHDEERALFGGWRIEDLRGKDGSRE